MKWTLIVEKKNMVVLENVWTFVTICVPDRLPQSLGLCRILGGGDKKSMGLNNNYCHTGEI